MARSSQSLTPMTGQFLAPVVRLMFSAKLRLGGVQEGGPGQRRSLDSRTLLRNRQSERQDRAAGRAAILLLSHFRRSGTHQFRCYVGTPRAGALRFRYLPESSVTPTKVFPEAACCAVTVTPGNTASGVVARSPCQSTRFSCATAVLPKPTIYQSQRPSESRRSGVHYTPPGAARCHRRCPSIRTIKTMKGATHQHNRSGQALTKAFCIDNRILLCTCPLYGNTHKQGIPAGSS